MTQLASKVREVNQMRAVPGRMNAQSRFDKARLSRELRRAAGGTSLDFAQPLASTL